MHAPAPAPAPAPWYMRTHTVSIYYAATRARSRSRSSCRLPADSTSACGGLSASPPLPYVITVGELLRRPGRFKKSVLHTLPTHTADPPVFNLLPQHQD
ncbi:hypothetical protein ACO22_05129 [Paracoccidioides brasiliensis]|uniref:Uncharacterized protein n=1 Tax=Paracoccidioides brasiliensis TaxID=121759 RepID=A0A1D2JB88_PARBR|nr:hypothetical protein ACO22_05129 [Paracoccidioides brasiliensis]